MPCSPTLHLGPDSIMRPQGDISQMGGVKATNKAMPGYTYINNNTHTYTHRHVHIRCPCTYNIATHTHANMHRMYTPTHTHIEHHHQHSTCNHTYTSQCCPLLYQGPIHVPTLAQTPRLTLSSPSSPPLTSCHGRASHGREAMGPAGG